MACETCPATARARCELAIGSWGVLRKILIAAGFIGPDHPVLEGLLNPLVKGPSRTQLSSVKCVGAK